MNRRQNHGFTLLEVLVAVFILATVLGLIVASGARYADAASRIRDKTIALWVAHNRLVEIQLSPVWPTLGKSDDDVKMAGRKWTWHVDVKKTEDQQLRRVDIDVTPKGKNQEKIISLSAFISSDHRSGS